MSAAAGVFDFFISRRGPAAGIAQEVAAVLRDAGYTVCLQDDNIEVGHNFVAEMHKMLTECRHLVAILTQDYLQSPYTLEEWTNFVALSKRSNESRRLIPLRVEDIEVTGLFAAQVYGDLVGVADPARRRQIILNAATGRLAPSAHVLPVAFCGVPPRNPDFFGRTKLLADLHRKLNAGDRPGAIGQTAIHGLGGIGKTSLAVEYAHEHAAEYAGVWWAQADSRTVLVDSLAELFSVLNPGQHAAMRANARELDDGRNREELAKTALAKLAGSQRPWLLVYDNVPSPGELRDLIPSAGARVLITTRWPNWAGQAASIELDVFDPLEASQLLLKLTGRSDRAGAVRLAKTLGYLPLALEQASAYIVDTGISFNRYADRADELIARAQGDLKYRRTVAATFNIGIERAVTECAAAENLLDFLSVLASECIPRNLIDGTILNEDDCDSALSALHRASLIKYDSNESDPDGTPPISVHRLVRAAMHQRLQAAHRLVPAVTAAIKRLAAAFPDKSYSDPNCWPRCKQLLPHVLMLRQEAQRVQIETAELAHLLDGAANYLLGRTAFADAEPLFKECLEIGTRILGPEHALVGQWLNNCGNLYLNSGHYEEAKEKYQAAISIGVKTLGRDHPDVATRINNMAYALMKTGHAEWAEAYYLEAIETSMKAYGRMHRKIAARLNNLGNLYLETGRYSEAEQQFREAIAMGDALLGPEHPDVCDWIGNLANVLRDTGRHGEAEPLYRNAIVNLTKIVGGEHSRVAFMRQHFAELYLLMGRLEEALDEASAAVAVHRAAYGPHHRWTKSAAELKSRVLAALGRPNEADQLRAEHRLDWPQAHAG
jgi:tetratricopeptide (TPR) repeat protein